jgi:hypothetical protein
MIIVPKRKIWTRQPANISVGLGENSPLPISNIKMLLRATPSGVVDIVNPRQVWTKGNGTQINAGSQGLQVSFDGSATNIPWTSTGYENLTGATGTFFAWFSRMGPVAGFGPIIFGESTGAYFQLGNADALNFLSFTAHVNSVIISNIYGKTNISLVATANTTAGSQRLYVNGLSAGSAAGTTPVAFPAGSKTLRLGGWPGSTGWNLNGDAVIVGFTTDVWNQAHARIFQDNPWKVFDQRTRRVFLPDSGGTATTVTCTTGNAVAEGVAAKTNLSLVTAPANAVAEGVVAKTNLSLVTAPANAVAEGIAAKINLSLVTIPASAVASGVTAQAAADLVIQTTPANAVAEGVAAKTNLALATTPANAVADGVAARTNLALATTPANAVADGVAARTNLALATTPANAVADGVAARINRTLITTAANAVAEGTAAKTNLSLVTIPANAVAAGVQASLDGSVRISATPANAVGAGITANVSLTLITSTGLAVAEGVTASLSAAVTVTCTPADATASGTVAHVDQAINCAAVAAAAEGVTASLVVGGIDVTITTTAGDAVADGVAANVVTMVTLVTTPANAVAEGVSSSVSGPSYVTCSVGNGVATGTTCLITVNVPFEAEVVNLRSALTKRVSLRSAL